MWVCGPGTLKKKRFRPGCCPEGFGVLFDVSRSKKLEPLGFRV